MEIIIRNSNKQLYGKTRSEQESNMRKEWGATMNDEQLDKLKYAEKKKKDFDGSSQNFIGLHVVDEVK